MPTILLALAGAAAADPRPLVAVDVTLAEPYYRQFFGPKSADVEAGLRGEVIAHLRREAGFLRFVAAGEAPEVDATLGFTLGSPQAGTLRPVDFTVELDGRRVEEAPGALTIPFRALENADLIPGTVDGFVHEAAKNVRKIERQTWVDHLFCTVVLSDHAHPFKSHGRWFWALPFKLAEVGARNATLFAVDANLTVDGNDVETLHVVKATGHVGEENELIPEPFRAMAMSQVQNPDVVEDLDRATSRKAERVLMRYYLGNLLDQIHETTPSALDIDSDVE